jgi:flavin reductase (DIM6/NTAB) family NADH-FMN oxidoreductase RutF
MGESISRIFRCLSHGVYVIGVSYGGEYNAFTAAWLTQASFDPLLLALSINPSHSSWPLIKASGRFSVNVLDCEQQEMAAHFGKPALEGDKLGSVAWRPSPAQMPILDHALAWMDCEYSHETPAGCHVVIIARVTAGELNQSAIAPLLYRDTGDMDGSNALFPEVFQY